MLEPGVQVRLETESSDDAVVVAVNVCVDTVQTLEDLLDRALEV